MADSLNSNAIDTKYDRFKNGGRQWSADISSNCLIGFVDGLNRVVDMLVLRHRFAQDVRAVSQHSRQGPDG